METSINILPKEIILKICQSFDVNNFKKNIKSLICCKDLTFLMDMTFIVRKDDALKIMKHMSCDVMITFFNNNIVSCSYLTILGNCYILKDPITASISTLVYDYKMNMFRRLIYNDTIWIVNGISYKNNSEYIQEQKTLGNYVGQIDDYDNITIKKNFDMPIIKIEELLKNELL